MAITVNNEMVMRFQKLRKEKVLLLSKMITPPSGFVSIQMQPKRKKTTSKVHLYLSTEFRIQLIVNQLIIMHNLKKHKLYNRM